MPTPTDAAAAGSAPPPTAPPHTALRCDMVYRVLADTHFCFNIQAVRGWGQRVLDEALTTTPGIAVRSYDDPNNGNRFLRLDAPGGSELRMRYDARVAREALPPAEQLGEDPISALPNEVLHYLMPTRYCESDVMSRPAQHLFGGVAPGWNRVNTLCNWIKENIAYQLGVSTSTTSAKDVYLQRAGVCRDYAHLGITFCRALNIPARLVVGYVHFDTPPQDFHAIFEAWLGGRWVPFDATGLAPVDKLVRVGTGRDAKDAAFSTLYGAVQMTHMQIQVHHDGTPPVDNPDPVEATVYLPGA